MKTVIISLKFFLFFTILLGVFYPLLITGIAQSLFPSKANGSLIYKHSRLIGSELIGQSFDSVIYFSSRPSAISYNPLPSGASNFGLTNTGLKNQVTARKEQFIAFNRLDTLSPLPSEMLFSSASGVDPHISPEAALLQVKRIASNRNLNEGQTRNLEQAVGVFTDAPQFWVLGEKRVNVLLLNLYIDSIQ
ncbi:MAG: potassium-transporting ATPase subunit KdpC [Bacteroidota bacterium]